jgi:phosphoribosylformylglycinamidine synthase
MGTLGLIESESQITRPALSSGDSIFVIGKTAPEMGGSEYYEYVHGVTGGPVPKVDLRIDKQNGNAVLNLIKRGIVTSAHDCSKGGLAVALAEMAIAGSTGFRVDLETVPNSCSRVDDVLFSESHSRYIIGTKDPDKVCKALSSKGITFAEIGNATTGIEFAKGKKKIVKLTLKQLQVNFYSLGKVMQ